MPSGPTTGPSHEKPEASCSRMITVCRHHSRRAFLARQILGDVVDGLLQPFHRSAAAGPSHVGNLREDIGAIGRQVGDDAFELPLDAPHRQAEQREHERDHDQHRGAAANPPLQPRDRRRQDEGQQNGEGKRNQDGLCPVEDADHEHAAREGHPRLQRLRGIVVHVITGRPIVGCGSARLGTSMNVLGTRKYAARAASLLFRRRSNNSPGLEPRIESRVGELRAELRVGVGGELVQLQVVVLLAQPPQRRFARRMPGRVLHEQAARQQRGRNRGAGHRIELAQVGVVFELDLGAHRRHEPRRLRIRRADHGETLARFVRDCGC